MGWLAIARRKEGFVVGGEGSGAAVVVEQQGRSAEEVLGLWSSLVLPWSHLGAVHVGAGCMRLKRRFETVFFFVVVVL